MVGRGSEWVGGWSGIWEWEWCRWWMVESEWIEML
jgi:hypothetical protein